MDMLFFLTGCLGLAETVDLFCGKDFLIFLTGNIRAEDYDLKKVFGVEKWLFSLDTLALFGISFHVGGFYVEMALLVLIFITLILHCMVFKSPKFRRQEPNRKNKKRR